MRINIPIFTAPGMRTNISIFSAPGTAANHYSNHDCYLLAYASKIVVHLSWPSVIDVRVVAVNLLLWKCMDINATSHESRNNMHGIVSKYKIKTS